MVGHVTSGEFAGPQQFEVIRYEYYATVTVEFEAFKGARSTSARRTSRQTGPPPTTIPPVQRRAHTEGRDTAELPTVMQCFALQYPPRLFKEKSCARGDSHDC